MKKRHFPKCMTFVFACSLLTLLCFNLVFAQSPDDFITITPENVDQLELGYVLPGTCGVTDAIHNLIAIKKVGIYDLLTGQRRAEIVSELGEFSSHGNYFWGIDDGVIETKTGKKLLPDSGRISLDEKYFAARENGVYDLTTQNKLFSIKADGVFSPDSKQIAVQNDALYDIETGKPLLRLFEGSIVFSPNSKYFAIAKTGVYGISTGQRLIKSRGIFPRFSPDSRYVSIENDGVYNLETRQKIVELLSLQSSSFSPDSKLIAIIGNGVYDLATGKRKFQISGFKYSVPQFIEGTSWFVVDMDGIYNLETNEKYFSISDHYTSVTQDASLIAIYKKGIYDTATGKQKVSIPSGEFFNHDKLIFSNLPAAADMTEGLFCGVYAIKGHQWSYRSGLVDTLNTQFYSTPNGDFRLDAQGIPVVTDAQQIVFAQTPDKKWFRVSASSWVRASDVKPVSLPDGIPIENP